MNTSIANDQLNIVVNSKGAELQSIYGKEKGLEYLWQGDPAYWGRRSPVLFPIIGRLKENTFRYEGNRFAMSQHGFARDREFVLEEKLETGLTYLLKSDEDTKKSFPFEFALRIHYSLQDNQLTTRYEIENPSDSSLLFSIGAHPAFNCPLRSGESRSDYSLVFNQPETLSRQFVSEGLRTNQQSMVLENASEIPITEDLFETDALIFEKVQSDRISLCHGDEKLVTMVIDAFDYLGLWSKNESSPFVCIEPWLGIADHEDHDQELIHKEGIIKLKGKETFTAAHQLIF